MAQRSRVVSAVAAGERPTPHPHRPSHPYRRLLAALRISAWGAAWLAVLLMIAVLLYLHRGDAEGSARIANREIEFLAARGDTVLDRVPVMQRHWWNYYRVTHGVLAATTRRLVYIGVPPEALFPHEDEPPDLEQASWPYDGSLQIRTGRVYRGTLPGFTISGSTGAGTFAVSPRDSARLDSVITVTEVRRMAIRTAQEAQRIALEATTMASRRPVYHLVQRGESLFGIADRYGADVDSLRAWNGVVRDRIYAGQRLLVKRGSE
jgi:hypothetical protein